MKTDRSLTRVGCTGGKGESRRYEVLKVRAGTTPVPGGGELDEWIGEGSLFGPASQQECRRWREENTT